MDKRKRQSGKHGKTIDVRSAGLVLDDLPEVCALTSDRYANKISIWICPLN